MVDHTQDELPTGTVTFVFTDIEGSTKLLQELGDAYPPLLDLHNELIRAALHDHAGIEIRTEGDAFFVVFESAADAAAAVAQAQQALSAQRWPGDVDLQVRIGLHTGIGMLGGGDYVGLDVHRAARIAGAAHGGQVVMSEATAVLVERLLPEGTSLRDLGKHRLKDLSEPETLFQLDIPGTRQEFPSLHTLDAIPNNLPLQVTSFVGREADLAEALRLLEHTRVLTLTGPGGTGKTRLSLQVAAEVAEGFPEGVYFVGLSPISDVDLVPSTILTSLGVPASSRDRSPEERLLDHLADKQALLVLDNFEQLLDAAPLVGKLVRAAPDSKFLVSSRAPLRISGEQEMPVPPLDLPDEGDLPSPEDLIKVEAVSLFVERAMAVRPDFSLTVDNAPAVAALVSRLDGLPLAIELVANRTKLLPPQAILDRFSSRMLSSGARDLPARQRTIWGAIDWSYDLLSPPERDLFSSLAVFAGGGRLEQIEAVCGPGLEMDILDGLATLVDHSLIRQQEDTGGVRFRMLHVIREYAAEKLEESGEASDIHKRHAEVYTELAEQAAPQLTHRSRGHWLDVLDDDHDNIRGAMTWSEENGKVDLAMRLAFAAWRFWQARGHLHEARRRIQAVLELPDGEPALRAKAEEACGGIAWWQGDMEACFEHYQKAWEIQKEVGSEKELANALYNLALAEGFGIGDIEASHRHLDEAEGLYTELGDVGGLADVNWGRGNAYTFALDDPERGFEYVKKSAELYRQAQNEFGLGWSLFELGETSRRLKRYDDARGYLSDGLRLFVEHDDVSAAVLFVAVFGGLAQDLGDQERAVRLAGAAHGLRISTGADIATLDTNQIEGLEYETLEALTGDLATAYREGRAMGLQEAAAYALEES